MSQMERARMYMVGHGGIVLLGFFIKHVGVD